MFMSGKVSVTTNDDEVIEGDLLLHEDLDALKGLSVYFEFKHARFKPGVFVLTDDDILTFIPRRRIRLMSSTRFC
jgi:hypothetical protein